MVRGVILEAVNADSFRGAGLDLADLVALG